MGFGVMTASARIAIPVEALEDFCRRHQIRELALFGSVLREDFRPDGDVDVLVEFVPGSRHTFFGLERMSRELAGLLGRSVELVTKQGLSPYLADRVLDAREVLYVQEG